MKINANKPRQLRKQKAWYYLPSRNVPWLIIVGPKDVIHIPARKLLKELLLTCPRGKNRRKA